jgi:rRNA maturation protein Rpf1
MANAWPDGITLIHLPNGPTAYFKLTSVQLTKEIFVSLDNSSRRSLSPDVGTC